MTEYDVAAAVATARGDIEAERRAARLRVRAEKDRVHGHDVLRRRNPRAEQFWWLFLAATARRHMAAGTHPGREWWRRQWDADMRRSR